MITYLAPKQLLVSPDSRSSMSPPGSKNKTRIPHLAQQVPPELPLDYFSIIIFSPLSLYCKYTGAFPRKTLSSIICCSLFMESCSTPVSYGLKITANMSPFSHWSGRVDVPSPWIWVALWLTEYDRSDSVPIAESRPYETGSSYLLEHSVWTPERPYLESVYPTSILSCWRGQL